VIGIVGPAAHAAVRAHFHGGAALREGLFPRGRIFYGPWLSRDADRDPHAAEGVVVVASSAHALEVHCHGGRAAVAALRESLVAQGVQWLSRDAWLESIAPSSAAAKLWSLVALTKTLPTTRIALDQARGALQGWAREVDQWGELHPNHALQRARDDGEAILARQGIGKHLIEPWTVVVAGQVNVGKSTLVNHLLGYRRTITFDAPGTTRDVVTAETAIEGWPVRLCDTAGVRSSDDPLECEGIQRALHAVEEADAVLVVLEPTAEHPPWTPEFLSILRSPWIVVINKIDSIADPGAAVARLQQRLAEQHLTPNAMLAISAITGEGIDQLEHRLARALVGELPPPGAPVPLLDEDVQALHEVVAARGWSDARLALKKLVRADEREPAGASIATSSAGEIPWTPFAIVERTPHND